MDHGNWLVSLFGGILIGLSATMMLGLLGRVAGISGIAGGILAGEPEEFSWRGAFLAGLVLGGWAIAKFAPAGFAMTLDRSFAAVAVAGLLVGFGSRLGSGCTSGHGVCGMARGSRRSIVATITFMATGALAAIAVTHLFAGSL